MSVTIRKFERHDIPNKVEWINNSENNQFLHYDLPLEIDKTIEWFERVKNDSNRYDAIIEVDNNPVGLIGLLNIGEFKAEYYITIGEGQYRGKNVAKKASNLLLHFAFNKLEVEKVYLYTEQGNIAMQNLASRIGMLKESILINHLIRENKYRNCFYYSISEADFYNKIIFPSKIQSEIDYLYDDSNSNKLYIKRDDLIPFSFGGNKSRKITYFFDEILDNNYNMVITYGSKSSNHCRVVSNFCAKHGLKCVIISPKSNIQNSINQDLVNLTNAEVILCDVEDVATTIEDTINKKTRQKEKVYFIPGGGHGNQGTQAYVDAYHEIVIWERRNNIQFDYIFLASGTGTTQAGLVVGQLLHKNITTNIIGISIAREKTRGSKVIKESIMDYFQEKGMNQIKNIDQYINFYDKYTVSAYGESDFKIRENVKTFYLRTGIPISTTYTGKALSGMENYIKAHNIMNKNVLFINTGGSPLFFDDLENNRRK